MSELFSGLVRALLCRCCLVFACERHTACPQSLLSSNRERLGEGTLSNSWSRLCGNVLAFVLCAVVSSSVGACADLEPLCASEQLVCIVGNVETLLLAVRKLSVPPVRPATRAALVTLWVYHLSAQCVSDLCGFTL